MGNRMIKETIRTDLQINRLTDFQFRLWTYLLTYVDDYGRGSADPDLVKGFCFPRRKDVTAKSISAGFKELQSEGLVKIYRVGEEMYFYFPSWEKHQRIQAKRSLYPEPPSLEDCDSFDDSTVTHGDPPLTTVDHGNPPPEVEVEVEVEEEIEYTSAIADVCAELKNSEPEDGKKEQALFELPTNTGEVYPFYSSDINSYKSLYPSVNVEQEMRKMIGWLDANPKRRKTKTGMKRFVNAWLSSEQDKYKPADALAPAAKKPTGTKFNNFEQRNDDIDADMQKAFMQQLKGVADG
nr:MAG TPA: replisome organizer [Caudoviricetes sp.]